MESNFCVCDHGGHLDCVVVICAIMNNIKGTTKMNLDRIIFWVSPLSHDLYIGVPGAPNEVTAKREITGLMINAIVEQMLAAGNESYDVERNGIKYNLAVKEIGPV
jgi:hypothetical protein